MRLYIEFIKNAFISNTAYKMNSFLSTLSMIIQVVIQVAIWKALFNNAESVSSSIGTISIQDMITYTIVSMGVSIITYNQVIGDIDQKIRTGEISMDLIKPIDLKLNFICNTVGNNLFNLFFKLVPVLVFSILVFGIQIPNWQSAILFIISLLNGMVIYFLITYILGLINFWYLSAGIFSRFLEDFIRLFSGSIIPLWFFPRILSDISAFLPFKLIYYVPISIYLNKLDTIELYKSILLQIMWILALMMLQKFLWKKGIKRLVIQGG